MQGMADERILALLFCGVPYFINPRLLPRTIIVHDEGKPTAFVEADHIDTLLEAIDAERVGADDWIQQGTYHVRIRSRHCDCNAKDREVCRITPYVRPDYCIESAGRWQCDTCRTRYAEYVNGCPHCETVGIRSRVESAP